MRLVQYCSKGWYQSESSFKSEMVSLFFIKTSEKDATFIIDISMHFIGHL